MHVTVGSVLGGFVVMAAILWPIEYLRPAVAAQPRWRRDMPTDLAYWLFTPLATRAITRCAVGAAVVLLAVCAGVPLQGEAIRVYLLAGEHGVRAQPMWLQVIEVLFIGDLVGYWMHRAFRGKALWTFHAVHHSSTQVDWLSSARLHPVNDVLTRAAQAHPGIMLGYPPTVLAAYVPLLSFYAILIHANVPWDFGPLRYVVASPLFHRWHHGSEAEGQDTNFAGLFPVLDLLFGTFYMPPNRQPLTIGIAGNPVPAGLAAQLWYPFAARRTSPS
jgi:sterol desaturase/sphingolipid hydroxylase (fatty acid hydroxylase superfamily)